MRALHFVLDQNFPPLPVVKWPPTIRFSHLKAIDERLTRGFEDWQVLLALHQYGGVDAFVTQDFSMLSLAAEMVVLTKLELCLVVTKDSGHDPIRAAGLLMAGLDGVINRIQHEKRRIVVLSLQVYPWDVGTRVNRIAKDQQIDPPDLIARELERVGDLDRLLLASSDQHGR